MIKKTINRPQQKVPDKDDLKREVYQSVIVDFSGREKILRVIIEETEGEILAITAYLSSKISKYWRKIED